MKEEKTPEEEIQFMMEGYTHVDTWDAKGRNRSWNIPNSFEPDLPFEERLAKWKAAHPEYDNFGDMDYARELIEKFVKSNDEL